MNEEKNTSQVLVVAAMPKEEIAIIQNLATAKLWADVFQTGIGKVNAGVCTTAQLYTRRRACVLSVGCSGALDPELEPGDIVVGTDTAYWDVDCGKGCFPGQIQGMPPSFPCDPPLPGMIFDELERGGFKPKYGIMLTGDRFVTDEGAISSLRKTFPHGKTIDMETAAVAHACWRLAVPFAAVRVISDSPDSGDGKSRAEKYHEFWRTGGLDRFAFVRCAVRAAQRFVAERGVKCLADA